MKITIKKKILADLLTRCLIGTTPTKDEMMKTLVNFTPKFNVQNPTEYNENFKNMIDDLAVVIDKYFD